jgi:hypothetical protein
MEVGLLFSLDLVALMCLRSRSHHFLFSVNEVCIRFNVHIDTFFSLLDAIICLNLEELDRHDSAYPSGAH